MIQAGDGLLRCRDRMTAPETPTLSGPCLAEEDIAAFLDATSSVEERTRVVCHLARCESCYELFAGAAHLVRELDEAEPENAVGQVLRFAPRLPRVFCRCRVRWLASAAALVVASGIAYRGWLDSPPPMRVAELTAPLMGAPRADGVLQEVRALRGRDEEGAVSSDVPSFLVGVSEVDLALGMAAGDVESSSRIASRIGALLRRVDLMEGEAETFKVDAARLTSRAALRRFAAGFPAREAALETDRSSLLAEWAGFGKWTEASRIAAATRTGAFFRRRSNRRFLSWLLRRRLLELDAETKEVLGRVEAVWELGPDAPGEFRSIEEELGKVIDRMETRLGAGG